MPDKGMKTFLLLLALLEATSKELYTQPSLCTRLQGTKTQYLICIHNSMDPINNSVEHFSIKYEL